MSEYEQLQAIQEVVQQSRKKESMKWQNLLLEAEDVLRMLSRHGKYHNWFDDIDGLEALAHIVYMLRKIDRARGSIAAAS